MYSREKLAALVAKKFAGEELSPVDSAAVTAFMAEEVRADRVSNNAIRTSTNAKVYNAGIEAMQNTVADLSDGERMLLEPKLGAVLELKKQENGTFKFESSGFARGRISTPGGASPKVVEEAVEADLG